MLHLMTRYFMQPLARLFDSNNSREHAPNIKQLVHGQCLQNVPCTEMSTFDGRCSVIFDVEMAMQIPTHRFVKYRYNHPMWSIVPLSALHWVLVDVHGTILDKQRLFITGKGDCSVQCVLEHFVQYIQDHNVSHVRTYNKVFRYTVLTSWIYKELGIAFDIPCKDIDMDEWKMYVQHPPHAT